MRNIPANTWRARLNEDDWNFSILDQKSKKVERISCLDWELHRERIQAESGGHFPSSIEYEPTNEEQRIWRFLGRQNEDIRGMLERLGRKPKGKLFKPSHLSYLEKRRSEKWQPIRKEARETWHWIALDWHSLHRCWGDEVAYAGTHLPSPPIVDGSDQATEIVPFKIPWRWRDAEISEAFRQWLKEFRPKGERGDPRVCVAEPLPLPAKPTGAKSALRQARKNLKALAAWRLIQHYMGDHQKAYNHPGAKAYLRDAYRHASEWSDAKKTIRMLLEQHLQLSRQGKILL